MRRAPLALLIVTACGHAGPWTPVRLPEVPPQRASTVGLDPDAVIAVRSNFRPHEQIPDEELDALELHVIDVVGAMAQAPDGARRIPVDVHIRLEESWDLRPGYIAGTVLSCFFLTLFCIPLGYFIDTQVYEVALAAEVQVVDPALPAFARRVAVPPLQSSYSAADDLAVVRRRAVEQVLGELDDELERGLGFELRDYLARIR